MNRSTDARTTIKRMEQTFTAYIPTLIIMITVIIGSISNNARFNHLDTRIVDVKNLLRAEIRAGIAEVRGDVGKLDSRLQRLEDHRPVRN